MWEKDWRCASLVINAGCLASMPRLGRPGYLMDDMKAKPPERENE